MTRKISDILIVSDMDGTLLCTDKTLLSSNIETIRLFTALGGKFAIATGRVLESIAQYADLFEMLTATITSGGCVIYDYNRHQVVSNAIIPRISAEKAVNEVMRQFPNLGILVNAADGRNYQVSASPALDRLVITEKITIFLHPQECLPIDWNKVLFAGPKDLLEDVEDFVSQRSYEGIHFVSTSPQYFEMMPKDVNKGNALEVLCAAENLSIKNTIAIGDYYNDIDMMKAAGHSVAMGNAPREIQAICDETTASCDESGVGQYIYRLIKELGA